ncbi:DUF402 domain-containing protein [Candidatus Poribacteria bacterium]|nr:DUF402 domain-containing protein [Candidatus Poribacteria bacterium]
MSDIITLTYKRLPDRINYFEQALLFENSDIIITTQKISPSSPIIFNGKEVLADNYTAIWFVFTDLWYDIGKIFNLENEWTGYYCDIIMPVTRNETKFEIVDLFLDLWVSPEGGYAIQDEDEFEEAVINGVISQDITNKARTTLDNLIDDVIDGRFPPKIVKDYNSITSF